MFLILSHSCLCPFYWSHVLSWIWRCSWSSADRWCSNYIWVINNLIVHKCASYIRDLTVCTQKCCVLFCCGYILSIIYGSVWSILFTHICMIYSAGSVKQPWRIWVKLTHSKHNTAPGCMHISWGALQVAQWGMSPRVSATYALLG